MEWIIILSIIGFFIFMFYYVVKSLKEIAHDQNEVDRLMEQDFSQLNGCLDEHEKRQQGN